MEIGDLCNWKNQPEKLIYLGLNFSGNGYWHQFALVERPDEVWCEVPRNELHYFEKTIEKTNKQ